MFYKSSQTIYAYCNVWWVKKLINRQQPKESSYCNYKKLFTYLKHLCKWFKSKKGKVKRTYLFGLKQNHCVLLDTIRKPVNKIVSLHYLTYIPQSVSVWFRLFKIICLWFFISR